MKYTYPEEILFLESCINNTLSKEFNEITYSVPLFKNAGLTYYIDFYDLQCVTTSNLKNSSQRSSKHKK